jgi:hypothetical protein
LGRIGMKGMRSRWALPCVIFTTVTRACLPLRKCTFLSQIIFLRNYLHNCDQVLMNLVPNSKQVKSPKLKPLGKKVARHSASGWKNIKQKLMLQVIPAEVAVTLVGFAITRVIFSPCLRHLCKYYLFIIFDHDFIWAGWVFWLTQATTRNNRSEFGLF